jgi:hypothetical protein
MTQPGIQYGILVSQHHTRLQLLIPLLGQQVGLRRLHIIRHGQLRGTQVSQRNTRLPHRTLRLGRQLETLQPRGQLHIRPHSIRHSQRLIRPRPHIIQLGVQPLAQI